MTTRVDAGRRERARGKSGVPIRRRPAGARKEKRFPGIPEGTDSAKEGPPDERRALDARRVRRGGGAPAVDGADDAPRRRRDARGGVAAEPVGGSGAPRGEGGARPPPRCGAERSRGTGCSRAAGGDALDLI